MRPGRVALNDDVALFFNIFPQSVLKELRAPLPIGDKGKGKGSHWPPSLSVTDSAFTNGMQCLYKYKYNNKAVMAHSLKGVNGTSLPCPPLSLCPADFFTSSLYLLFIIII